MQIDSDAIGHRYKTLLLRTLIRILRHEEADDLQFKLPKEDLGGYGFTNSSSSLGVVTFSSESGRTYRASVYTELVLFSPNVPTVAITTEDYTVRMTRPSFLRSLISRSAREVRLLINEAYAEMRAVRSRWMERRLMDNFDDVADPLPLQTLENEIDELVRANQRMISQ